MLVGTRWYLEPEEKKIFCQITLFGYFWILEMVKDGNFIAGTLNICELMEGYLPIKLMSPRKRGTASVNRKVRTGYLISPFSIFQVPSRVKAVKIPSVGETAFI
jgi:hypothetical protein